MLRLVSRLRGCASLGPSPCGALGGRGACTRSPPARLLRSRSTTGTNASFFSSDAAAAAGSPAGSADKNWYEDPKLSVRELHDEIFRRWADAPTPGTGAVYTLLARVSNAEEVALARETVERFHKQRCAAGFLTGLGARVSGLFAQACTRNGAHNVAVEAFVNAARLGLVHSHAAHRLILASASQKEGAAGTLDVYRKLKATGRLHATPEIARLVLRGLQAGPEGSPARALAAAQAFLAEGIRPGRRAWNSLLCAAAGRADLRTLHATAELMRAEDSKPPPPPEDGEAREGAAVSGPPVQRVSSIMHLCLAEGHLLAGETEKAHAELRTALSLLPQLVVGEEEGKRALAAVMCSWVTALPASTATPGGAQGLKERCDQALAGLPFAVDLGASFEGKTLVDGPLDAAAA